MLLLNLWEQGVGAVIAFAIVIILAFAYHEFGHAIVADKLGDPTPRRHGRITLNPFPHLSMQGLVMLFLFGFGWATTPVNPNALRGNKRRSHALVAIAGPAMNLLMALLFAAAYTQIDKIPFPEGSSGDQWATFVDTLCWQGILWNCVLMYFNLMPIPPLDGFTILQGILPLELAYRLDFLRQYGMIILLGAIFLLPRAGINFIQPAIDMAQFLSWFAQGF